MRNSLNHLLRERFQGHEAPVDPALWQVIEARLIAAGPATDPVNELFRERFEEHEAEVDPGVWDGISQQLGHGAGAAAGSVAQWGWWAAGIGAIAITAGLYFASTSTQPAAVAETKQPTEQAAPQPAEAALPVVEEQPAETTPVSVPELQPAVVAPQQPVTKKRPAPPAKRDTPSAVKPVLEDEGAAESTPGEETEVVENIIESITTRALMDALSQETAKPDTEKTPPAATPPPAAEAPAAVAPATEALLFLPNTFTPNSDGFNDSYQIVPRAGTTLTSLMVRVYSMKSNQLVFSSSSLQEHWTGAGCEDGMYMVAVEAITTEGRVISEGRVVWLNRSSMN